jgi:hypothetical protein
MLDVDGDGSADQVIEPYTASITDPENDSPEEGIGHGKRLSRFSVTPSFEELVRKLCVLLEELLLTLEKEAQDRRGI